MQALNEIFATIDGYIGGSAWFVYLLIGAGLYTFLLAWNEFLFAVVLIEAWEKRVITMAIYSLMAEFVTDWSMMMAFSVLASAPLVIAFIFLQRYMVRGLTLGAVKT